MTVYDTDLFETPGSTVQQLHQAQAGTGVICYMSVGTWEAWRPDASQFPAALLGKANAGWSGERYLDIRSLDLLQPLMLARLQQCRDHGYDAVEPDNMDSYSADTGFPLTFANQMVYNQWLVHSAHALNLSIGQKNDQTHASLLQPLFDFAIVEDCFALGWCDLFRVYIAANKTVLMAEYTDTRVSPSAVCPYALEANMSAIFKHRSLDAFRYSCQADAVNRSWPRSLPTDNDMDDPDSNSATPDTSRSALSLYTMHGLIVLSWLIY